MQPKSTETGKQRRERRRRNQAVKRHGEIWARIRAKDPGAGRVSEGARRVRDQAFMPAAARRALLETSLGDVDLERWYAELIRVTGETCVMEHEVQVMEWLRGEMVQTSVRASAIRELVALLVRDVRQVMNGTLRAVEREAKKEKPTPWRTADWQRGYVAGIELVRDCLRSNLRTVLPRDVARIREQLDAQIAQAEGLIEY